ncbi:MAG: glutamate--tRNA ligase [Clostridiales Family XIII bacterium]|nr:glutamate--tRNA ligase [Clostridiales Family XIII bacterium]
MADLLFSHVINEPSGGDTSYYEGLYPPRDIPREAAVTRLGPSPTGFIHLGNLYTAFMNEKLSRQTGGIFYLRIEDTDNKREVEGAALSLITSLRHFGVSFDEGVSIGADMKIIERGAYGPYHQSQRREIYHAYARRLIIEGKAYPCFMTEEELDEIRSEQESNRETPGVYGKYAKYRDITAEQAGNLLRGENKYVIRLNADAANSAAGGALPLGGAAYASDEKGTVTVVDGIRGRLTFPKNEMDVVLLKSDGIPTYHFAHVIDDHLMRTTHVIRGEEWLSSLPIHLQLADTLGFTPPVYCHSTVLMKIENGKKRKLSKRKDPELSLEYYREEGYHPQAILEYLLTVINSNFEEWRDANPNAPISEFKMTTEKMGVSGILFDLDKLEDVSKNVLARIPASDLADFMIRWARLNREDVYSAIADDAGRLVKILDIGRSGDKPRKDLAYASQIWDFIKYFYDDYFEIADPWPENVPPGDVIAILKSYDASFNLDDDRDTWFAKIRQIAKMGGYAEKPKDYKREPEKYKGHVGDVSTVIRIALVGRANSPDIYEIQQILGADEVRMRLAYAQEA